MFSCQKQPDMSCPEGIRDCPWPAYSSASNESRWSPSGNLPAVRVPTIRWASPSTPGQVFVARNGWLDSRPVDHQPRQVGRIAAGKGRVLCRVKAEDHRPAHHGGPFRLAFSARHQPPVHGQVEHNLVARAPLPVDDQKRPGRKPRFDRSAVDGGAGLATPTWEAQGDRELRRPGRLDMKHHVSPTRITPG